MKESIFSILENYGELTLDNFLEEGLLKDIPVVGTVFNTIKLSRGIQDRIFIEKMKVFIENVDKNSKWKDKFSDLDECNKISKKLLYIIDSSDEDNKIRLIAILFNYYVVAEITKEEFLYLSSIISKSYYPYLRYLKKINDLRFTNDNSIYDSTTINHLYSLGLFDYSGNTVSQMKDNKVVKRGSAIVSLNSFGNILKQIVDHHD